MTTAPDLAPKPVAASRFVMSALMSPEHANMLGKVHGGVITKMVDETGAIVAMRHSRQQVVTVAIDSMTFMHPINVGDLVQCTGTLTYAGRTSMEVRIEVRAENPFAGAAVRTNTAYCVYVALDAGGRPAPVPPVQYETDAERVLAAQAAERQAWRLRQRQIDQTHDAATDTP